MEKAFSNIKTLILKGGGNITVQDDGQIVGASKAFQSGNTLTLEGESYNMMIFNNGNVSNSFSSRGISMVSSGGSSYIMGNGNNYNIQGNGNIMINGVKVDMSRLKEIAVDEKDLEPKDTYKLDGSCSLNSVNIKGSMNLNSIPLKFVDSNSFSVNIAGSGDVNLPNKKDFQTVNINIAGSGDVSGCDTATQKVVINVAGSGDVRGIHVNNSGMISIMGSGDVRISATHPNRISKSKMGSGSIRVK